MRHRSSYGRGGNVSRYFALKNVMLHKFSGSINSYDGHSRVGYELGRPYWFWSY